MPIESQAPAGVPENPYLPPGGSQALTMDQFAGVNTATTRAGVADEMCFWLDGWFPQAPRNARVLYGVGTTLYTASGTTVVWFGFANIGSTPYCIIFLANGQVVAVNTNTSVATTILNAGTITAPTILNCGMTQWGSQYVIIVADQSNGYWIWDGNTVYTAGSISPIITMTNVGAGYTSAPTVVLTGGHGSGSSLTASLNSSGQIVGVSVVNPGTGYLAIDTVSVSFIGGPSGGSGASITGTLASIAGGGPSWSLNSLSVVSGGSLYSGTPTIVFASAVMIASPTAIAIVSGGSITGTSITGRGFFSSGTIPAITVTLVDAGVTASATAQLMPFGIQGTCAEVYSGRVWIGKQATVYYAAPGSFSNFATSAGGGNFTSTDSFLKVGFSRLVQTNGFLYLVGDSSVNYISGVQTSGSPPTTTFTNQNADPEVGSPYPQSVILQGQNILFANSIGVYVINGSRAVKVSDFLDNTYNSVANFGGMQLSSAAATIFGRKVWMTLVKIVDPVSGSTVNKVLMWDGKRWWASPQDITLTYLKNQEINSVITVYGTNGTIVCPLFSTPSTAFQKTIQSKYWDAPGALLTNKAVNRFWGLLDYYSASASTNLIVSIDSVGVSSSGQFSTSNGYTITGPSQAGYFVTPPEAVGQQGVLNGMTIKTNAADVSMIEAAIVPVPTQYRG